MQQTKMKAAMREQYCSADQMEIREIPIPQPKADEVLVRVHCTTVNRTDEGVLLGKPYIFRFFVGWPKPRYQVLGTDFAGEVVALGANVMGFEKGDRVFGFMDHGLPTQAEYAAIPISKPILPIPDGVSYHDAVASLEGVHYAINFLKHFYQILREQ